MRKLFADGFDEFVFNSDNNDVLDKLVVVKNFFDPAATAQNSAKAGRLHVGMVIEYDERERFLNSIGPEFAHVMIIAVVKKVNTWLWRNVVCGIAAIFDAAFTFAASFCVVNRFVNFLDGVIVAVAVGSYDFGAVEPANVLACFCGGAQFLHEGLLGINAREILNRNHHDSKIAKMGVGRTLFIVFP